VEVAKARFPEIDVREWDIFAHPELGPRYGVVSTPAVVINGRLAFRGVPTEHALIERLEAARRGPAAEP
jgi:hypothetical protein